MEEGIVPQETQTQGDCTLWLSVALSLALELCVCVYGMPCACVYVPRSSCVYPALQLRLLWIVHHTGQAQAQKTQTTMNEQVHRTMQHAN